MCTLCLSDMGELRDDWLREPTRALPVPAASPIDEAAASAVQATRNPAQSVPELEAAA